MELVRIIILQYNHSALTIDLVNSLYSQDYKNIEIVIVDNHSNENEVIKLKEELGSKVHIVFSEVNLGYAKGNNLGCKCSTGKLPFFFLILNNDISIKDNSLISKLVSTIRDNPKYIAVSPLVDTLSSKIPIRKQIQVRRIPKIWTTIILSNFLLKRIFKKIYNTHIYKDLMPYDREIFEVESINGAAFLIQADFFQSIGYFDENTFLYAEELILGHTIKKNNLLCALNATTYLLHYQGVSSFNTNKDMYQKESMKYYFISKLNPKFIEIQLLNFAQFTDSLFKKVYSKVKALR